MGMCDEPTPGWHFEKKPGRRAGCHSPATGAVPNGGKQVEGQGRRDVISQLVLHQSQLLKKAILQMRFSEQILRTNPPKVI